MKALNLVAALSLSLTGTFAQSHDAPEARVADISIMSGFWLNEATYTGQEDFRKLAPSSLLLSQDLSKYSNSPFTANSGGAGINLMSNIRLKKPGSNQFRDRVYLRLGLSYRYCNFLSDQYHKEERSPYDTLYNSGGTPVVYIDSVSQQSVGMNYALQTAGIHAAIIWNTDPARRLSLYGGAGLSFSHALKATTSISQFNYGYLIADNQKFPNEEDYQYGQVLEERVDNQVSYGFAFYTPMGVDWKLGHGSSWLRPWHLFLEWRPGVDFRNIPELELISKFHSYQGFGIKYSFS